MLNQSLLEDLSITWQEALIEKLQIRPVQL